VVVSFASQVDEFLESFNFLGNGHLVGRRGFKCVVRVEDVDEGATVMGHWLTIRKK